MKRPLLRLDELVSLAERGDWSHPYWKPAFNRELEKASYEKSKTRWDLICQSAVMVPIFALIPVAVWASALHWTAGLMVGAAYYVFLPRNYNDWWAYLRDFRRAVERYRKLELINRRYFEKTGLTLGLKVRKLS